VRQIKEERAHPRCDVFWNNEIAQTVRLAHEGLLAPYDSPAAADIPAAFRDPERRWTGFAARARVFIVNTERVPDPSVITGMWDLIDPRWAGQVGVARPLTGTTLTHAAALYEALGAEEAERYWGFIAAHQDDDVPPVSVVRSNGQLATLVRDGELAWGWTDTDDYNVMREKSEHVAVVYPDQLPGPNGEAPQGTLLIPNTVMLIEGAPHPEAGKRFIDWVLSREMERRLAHARSAQIPVRAGIDAPPHVRTDFAVLAVDYSAVGERMDEHNEHLRKLFLRRN
jgi:iron(III) transport system substrate-binding protein